jgi:hypothetical protein
MLWPGRTGRVLRSLPMRKTPALFLALSLLFAAPAPGAPPRPDGMIDSGRLIVLDRGTPVGYEDFEFERRGDSLVVSGIHTRTMRESDGSTVKWVKKFGLIVDGRDFALRQYTSNLEFGGHLMVRGIVPGDTAMTVFTEQDGSGTAERLVQPPGRLFVMDPPLFTLFDVLCRNVSAQSLSRRPVELVTLGEKPATARATMSAAGPDTIRWGGKRMVARRYVIADDQGTFLAWVSPEGRMLRLLHEASALEVLREEPGARDKRPR